MTAITCLPVPVPGPGMAPPVARALPAGVYWRRRTVVATGAHWSNHVTQTSR